MLTGRRFFGLRLWPSERAGAEPHLTPADTPGSGVWRWGRRGPGSPGRLGVVLAADGRIALRQLLDRGGVRAALPPRLGQLALRLAQQIQVIRMQLLQVARQPAGHSPRSHRPQAGPRASRPRPPSGIRSRNGYKGLTQRITAGDGRLHRVGRRRDVATAVSAVMPPTPVAPAASQSALAAQPLERLALASRQAGGGTASRSRNAKAFRSGGDGQHGRPQARRRRYRPPAFCLLTPDS